MKNYRQLLLNVLCATMLSGFSGAMASDDIDTENEFASKIASGENVVLFKIHDIKPVKNEEGLITNCEFSLTLYNRSPKNIDMATMQLSWLDEGVSSVIDEEDKKEIEEINDNKARGQLNNSRRNLQNPKTEDVSPRALVTSVVLPQIKPFRQVSLKSKLKSDRCFLMIQDAEYSFSSCSISSDKGSSAPVRGRVVGRGEVATECQSLFRFVSPRDPEYYREFQKVAFNEEAEKRKKARNRDVKELEDSYNVMVESLNTISETLKSIK